MAEVTGPISSMPGAHHDVPDGMMCDLHRDRPAVARIQGETDSMGAELNDMCQECLDAYRVEISKPYIGRCDWCKREGLKLRSKRDWEEGTHGPVYLVCDDCSTNYNRRVAEEFQNDWNEDDPPDDDYRDDDGDYDHHEDEFA
jgi:hypothetical protein